MLNELRDGSRPVLVFEETTIPAASLWSGAKRWIDELAGAGLEPGDRIVVSLEPGPALVQLLLAAFWDKYSLVLADSNRRESPRELEDIFDARLSVGHENNYRHSINPHEQGPGGGFDLRDYQGVLPRTPVVRLFQRADSSHPGIFYGFSAETLTDQAHQFPTASSTVSLGDWYRVDSLVANLLGPLLEGSQLLVANSLDDTPKIRRNIERFKPDQWLLPKRSESDLESFKPVFESGEKKLAAYRPEPPGAFKSTARHKDSLEGGFDSVTCWLSLPVSSGPVAFRRGDSPEPNFIGRRIRTGENGQVEVLSESTPRVRYDPDDGDFEYRDRPDWITTGLTDGT